MKKFAAFRLLLVSVKDHSNALAKVLMRAVALQKHVLHSATWKICQHLLCFSRLEVSSETLMLAAIARDADQHDAANAQAAHGTSPI